MTNLQYVKNLFSRISIPKQIKRREKFRNKLPNQNYKIKVNRKDFISLIKKVIKLLESQMDEIIKNDTELNLVYNTLMDVNGVSTKTTYTLIACLPELGKTDDTNIIDICGFTPINQNDELADKNAKITTEKKYVRDVIYHITTLSNGDKGRYCDDKLDLLKEEKLQNKLFVFWQESF